MNWCHFRYKHAEKGSESDTFMFDVTNGIQSLHGLEFVIEIIPKLIPLEIRDFAVMEGDHKLLTGITLQHRCGQNVMIPIPSIYPIFKKKTTSI